MKNKKLILPLAMFLGLSSFSMAQDLSGDLELLNGDFRIAVDGEINTNLMHNGSGPVNTSDSFVTLSATWKDKIRAVITAKLDHLLSENGANFNDDFSLAEFIKEAYIEIRDVGGAPVALVVGKQPIAFGQNVQAMPIFNNNPMAGLQEVDQVFGFTVDLSEGLFGIFDRAELSVFETEANDLEIGRIDGVSIRLSKMLTNQILLTLSHTEMGNSHLTTGHERRTSVGLIAESTDGFLVGWIEGMYFSNNPAYQNSNFGITTGVMMRVHETTDVVVEYTWIEKELQEIALGAKLALTRNLTVGPEIRYRDYNNGRENELIFGISATYRFGTSGANRNEQYLFGND